MKNKKKLKYILIVIAVFVLVFSGTKLFFKANSFKGEIDKIEIFIIDEKTKGNLKSKTIEDTGEIALFIKALNSAKVSKKVKNEDIDMGKTSKYLFYEDEDLIKTLVFSDKTSEKIINKDKIYKVKYKEKNLFNLYKNSKATELEIEK